MPLRIEGAVLSQATLTFEDLAALPDQIADISDHIPGRNDGGVLLRSVLNRAGLKPNVTHLTCESTDGGFSSSVPLSAVREAIIAYRLGDAPLPADKGGPIRFYIPDAAACDAAEVDQCANVKYLGRLILSVGARYDTRPQSPEEHAELHPHHDDEGSSG